MTGFRRIAEDLLDELDPNDNIIRSNVTTTTSSSAANLMMPGD